MKLRTSIVGFSLFILTTAFQCRNDLIVLIAHADLNIDPNPIYVTAHGGDFQFEVVYPQSKLISKIDSIRLEFLAKDQPHNKVLGRSTLAVGQETSKKNVTRHSDHISFDIEITSDTVPLLMNWSIYENDRMRTSPNLEIGLLVKDAR